MPKVEASDLLFNTAALAVVVLLARIRILRGTVLAPLVLGGLAIGFLSFVIPPICGLRVFGTIRCMGQGIFWHVPLLLAGLALRHGTGRAIRVATLSLATALVALYAWAYHVEPYRLEVTEHTFTDPRLSGLLRPVRLAQVSDIQTDRVGKYEQRVFATLAGLAPDMILYTGDYTQLDDGDRNRRESIEKALNALLAGLARDGIRPEYGSYAVAGDTDPPGRWRDLFRGTSVTILEDSMRVADLPGARVNVIGLSPETSRTGGERLARLLRGRDPENLDIIVSHAPDHVLSSVYPLPGFLALAGHTHGGQVRLPFVGPLLTLSAIPREHAAGFSAFRGGVLSVSRGIGMERFDAPRLRLLCRPEIRMITLVPWSAPAAPDAHP